MEPACPQAGRVQPESSRVRRRRSGALKEARTFAAATKRRRPKVASYMQAAGVRPEHVAGGGARSSGSMRSVSGAERQHLDAGLGHQHGVLELRGQRAVDGDRRPVVVAAPEQRQSPRLIIGSMVKVMPARRRSPAPGLPKCGTAGAVWNMRPMPWPTKCAHHRAAARLDEALDRRADVADARAGAHPAMPRHSEREVTSTRRCARSASRSPTKNVRDVSPWKPSSIGRHVDVDDVAVAQHALRLGDAVADDLVHRRAAVRRGSRGSRYGALIAPRARVARRPAGRCRRW